MNDFYLTRMGNEYYTSTMPRLVKALERMNELLEKVVEQQSSGDAAETLDDPAGSSTRREGA